jgi:hypothetical protein
MVAKKRALSVLALPSAARALTTYLVAPPAPASSRAVNAFVEFGEKRAARE